MEMEEKEESEKIGKASLVSIKKNKKVRCLEDGMVYVIEKSRIELRNWKGGLIWHKVIMGEQYKKENIKIAGCPMYPGVCWTDEKGNDYGLVFDSKSRQMIWEDEKVRDKFFECIMEVQKKGEEDNMGFGLFD